ncbi:MAG TPA: hypothetical protein PKH77_26815 [Anaerolineae bacterium]|nr:hypothetical protein [Anaerolineae bacterium]
MKIQYNFMLGLCLLSLIIGLSSCATAPSIAQDYHVVPTPVNVSYIPPCNKPTWVVGEQEVCGFLVTPLPSEAVRVGSITVFSPTITNQLQLSYTMREDVPPWQPVTRTKQIMPARKLFIQDIRSGQEIRLGDEAGDAFLEIKTSQYVIWRYQWNGQSETTRKTGLYAHILETGEEISIAQAPDLAPWYPESDANWVIYTNARTANNPQASLRAYNLSTGEDFVLSETIPDYGRPASDYYAVSGNKVTYITPWKIHVYDLLERTVHTLAVPHITSPVNLSISGDIIVWWDKFWHGYDLQQDALFTIPTIPLGWENISVQPARPVTIKDDHLYWSLKVNEEIYHFTAPIIRNQ